VSGFCSMFSQLLKLFPRTEFQALVTRTHAERHARGFTCWGQFVAMLFCQLGRAHSLQAQAPGHHGPEPLHVGVCERTSPVATLSRRVPGAAGSLSAPGAGPADVPVQEQAGEPGLDHHRPVRDEDHPHVMSPPLGDDHDAGEVAVVVQQAVQLDGALGPAEQSTPTRECRERPSTAPRRRRSSISPRLVRPTRTAVTAVTTRRQLLPLRPAGPTLDRRSP
jgi:hypothetical protein